MKGTKKERLEEKRRRIGIGAPAISWRSFGNSYPWMSAVAHPSKTGLSANARVQKPMTHRKAIPVTFIIWRTSEPAVLIVDWQHNLSFPILASSCPRFLAAPILIEGTPSLLTECFVGCHQKLVYTCWLFCFFCFCFLSDPGVWSSSDLFR